MNEDKEMFDLGVKTIAELENNLKRDKELYYSLSKEERESEEGRNLLTRIQREDSLVKHFDYQIGDYRRNVGNYKDFEKGAVRGLMSGIVKGLIWGILIALMLYVILLIF